MGNGRVCVSEGAGLQEPRTAESYVRCIRRGNIPVTDSVVMVSLQETLLMICSQIAQRSILSSIDREMSGHTKKAYNSVVSCVLNPAEFFADELHTSMKGLGTDNKKLIRIIVSRAEVFCVCGV